MSREQLLEYGFAMGDIKRFMRGRGPRVYVQNNLKKWLKRHYKEYGDISVAVCGIDRMGVITIVMYVTKLMSELTGLGVKHKFIDMFIGFRAELTLVNGVEDEFEFEFREHDCYSCRDVEDMIILNVMSSTYEHKVLIHYIDGTLGIGGLIGISGTFDGLHWTGLNVLIDDLRMRLIRSNTLTGGCGDVEEQTGVD